MKKRFFAALLPLTLLLSLTACGGSKTDTAQQENDALRQQVEELEAACQTLSEENDLLNALNTDLRAELDGAAENAEENPIDRFFNSTETGSSTAEMNFVADSWAAAWEAEARSGAEWLKAQLPLSEDRALVDDFLATAEAQAARLTTMALYPIADLEVPQDVRLQSSGSLRGVYLAGSRQQLWRDTFFQLLAVAPEAVPVSDYPFLFDAEATQAALADGLASFGS